MLLVNSKFTETNVTYYFVLVFINYKKDLDSGSTLFGTDEFSSVPFLYMMTIKKDNYPQKYTHGNCPKKGIKSS
ncbi:MAG TPA: hypothetical protein H9958_01845, partial [Candidatus Limosilactobacillus intestinavium]|nr:hypothetical protein [Candidatus Limosilactobacillus intestinavium]